MNIHYEEVLSLTTSKETDNLAAPSFSLLNKFAFNVPSSIHEEIHQLIKKVNIS